MLNIGAEKLMEPTTDPKDQLALFQSSPGALPAGARPPGGAPPPRRPLPPAGGGGGASPIQDASLAEETQKRYLSYALSVVTSRALPDVRDGMKPVQRRILYGMQRGGVRHDQRHVKSARVVGDVMGKYHPHGDSAIYDALVRMAQSFTLRLPLVDGQGNFGSPDGDAAAAMRYTECRLSKASTELLGELDKDTVDFRPNYDGEEEEPTVLPARFPNLLVNGAQGIAVGMATSIPPHALGEVIDASVAMIDGEGNTTKQLLKHVKGPDFPTGGQLLSTRKELEEVYETGQGSLKLRGTWKEETPAKGNPLVVIQSIPYGLERKTVVAQIADIIIEKKLPLLLDVRDESTDETRIVCEVKKDADTDLVMAYLLKHTSLQTNVQVNLTCLMPLKTSDGVVTTPKRCSLAEMLRAFLDFRMEVVVRRLGYDLKKIRERIHILEGFVTIFDALDETIRIIRKSEGKQDAAQKLIKRFELSELQVDAILELRLYRLAQLEINIIRTELDEKKKEEKRLAALLSSPAARWKLIRAELMEIKNTYADRRMTKVQAVEETEYDAEAFIIDEDAVVLLSAQGWLKRQQSVRDLSATRVREGDSILDVVAGSTKASIALFSSTGACYVMRIVDVQATTGYGNPVQTLFKMQDGERIVKMLSFDPRILEVPPAEPETDGPLLDGKEPAGPHALFVTKMGQTSRFSLRGHRDVSTRAGRKYARLNDGDEVIYADVCTGEEKLACATVQGHALVCLASEVPILGGAGKGVRLVKLEEEDDGVVGARLLEKGSEPLIVENESGKQFEIGSRSVASRAGKGTPLFKRGKLVRAIDRTPTLPQLPEATMKDEVKA
jgi:DNA gyrase subunit A